ncbi:MAG: hypothetical protein SNJ75_06475 [Gemmataceae bacterium]
MLAALLLSLVTVSPAQASDLEIKNVRLTHGLLGQPRKDNKLLPGEIAVISFDVHGVKVAADGTVEYATGFELTAKGDSKPLLKQDLTEKRAVNSLGGDVLPSFTYVTFGVDTKPGEYTVKVTVQSNKKTATFTKDVEILRPQLGFVRARLTSAAYEPIPPIAVPGQPMLVQYALVGFAVERGAGSLEVEVVVVDEAGKPTTEAPAKIRFNPAPKDGLNFIEFKPLPLQLNRPGKFKVQLKANDLLKKASTVQELEIEVFNR